MKALSCCCADGHGGLVPPSGQPLLSSEQTPPRFLGSGGSVGTASTIATTCRLFSQSSGDPHSRRGQGGASSEPGQGLPRWQPGSSLCLGAHIRAPRSVSVHLGVPGHVSGKSASPGCLAPAWPHPESPLRLVCEEPCSPPGPVCRCQGSGPGQTSFRGLGVWTIASGPQQASAHTAQTLLTAPGHDSYHSEEP